MLIDDIESFIESFLNTCASKSFYKKHYVLIYTYRELPLLDRYTFLRDKKYLFKLYNIFD